MNFSYNLASTFARGEMFLVAYSWASVQSVSLTERQCGWDTHAAGHISWLTLRHRLTHTQTREGLASVVLHMHVYVCVCVCVGAYPVQSFGLYVPQQLLPPVGRHPGGDVFRLLWHDGPHFDGVFGRFLRAGCQGVVRRHLLQQGRHGGTGRHRAGLGRAKSE